MGPATDIGAGDSQDRSTHSVTRMIDNVKNGDMWELSRLMERLYEDQVYAKMMRYAGQKLGDIGAKLDDPEAVIQEAMSELAQRARAGRLETVDRRERLFGLLRLIVAEKARDFRRKSASRGGEKLQISLDQSAGDGSQSGGLHACLDDAGSGSAEEQLVVRDFLVALLERIEQDAPDPELWGTVFRMMLDDKKVSAIAESTEKTRTQINTIIEAIRGIAKGLRGDD